MNLDFIHVENFPRLVEIRCSCFASPGQSRVLAAQYLCRRCLDLAREITNNKHNQMPELLEVAEFE